MKDWGELQGAPKDHTDRSGHNKSRIDIEKPRIKVSIDLRTVIFSPALSEHRLILLDFPIAKTIYRTSQTPLGSYSILSRILASSVFLNLHPGVFVSLDSCMFDVVLSVLYDACGTLAVPVGGWQSVC